jgi:SGNH domain (fused to AT3 domains)
VSRLRTTMLTVVAVVVATGSDISNASTKIPLPPPGSAAQVHAAVLASTSISALSSSALPALADAHGDTPGNLYPVTRPGCVGTKQCVLGDAAATKTVVLFGDSHAQMWLPALVPIAKLDHFRLVVIWKSACPVVNVKTSSSGCVPFRTSSIAEIAKLHAVLVLLANRTTGIIAPGGALITKTAWQKGLETTIGELRSATTKVAVIGDITQFNSPVPDCLAAHPTNVQRCTVPNPNPKFTQKFAPEKAAAVATGAGYVDTQKWVCTKKCSPVIGNMIAYSDFGHVSATYAEYLTTVWDAAVTPMVKP